MKSKVCTQCKEERLLSEYYTDRRTRDGKFTECKYCSVKRSTEYIRNHKEAHNAACNKWYRNNAKKHLEDGRKWKKNNPEIVREIARRARKKHPERMRAYDAVKWAVKTRKLIRPEKCSKCNRESKVEAHHEDYHKKLDVIWLCRQCHEDITHPQRINYSSVKDG